MRPRWFVGGGTGVAPLLSMLRPGNTDLLQAHHGKLS